MPPDRSAGVQQGRFWLLRGSPEDGRIAHVKFGPPLKADEQVRVVEAVSPEPRPGWEIAREEHARLEAAGWKLVSQEYGDRTWSHPDHGEWVAHHEALRLAEPREEEQEPPDWNIEGMTEPEAGPPSVASVLRLTASRLRDPEHRWLEDPAVTLERLAEKLEKGRDDG